MSGDRNDVIYYLNEADEIVTVNCGWNRFARENGAIDALGPRVQWRPVWSFISDGTTALLCRRLIRRAREGRPVDFCLRCDGPATMRISRMRILRLQNGLLEVCVRTIGRVLRRPVPIVVARGRDAGATQWCSWCQRIEVSPGDWIEAGEAVRELGGFDAAHPLPVRPVSCPACVARMVAVADSPDVSTPSIPGELWPPESLRRGAWAALPPLRLFAGTN